MEEDIKVIRRYRKMVLFQEMSDDELRVISKVAKKASYKAGDIIFGDGEKGGTLYLINKGVVKITLHIVRFDDREETVSFRKEGDCFGELSLFDEKDHSARATAVEDIELLEINHQDYERIIKENIEIGFEIQSKILQKIINIVREMNTRYSYRPFIE
jgi:CRP-like cAMP-binding protein